MEVSTPAIDKLEVYRDLACARCGSFEDSFALFALRGEQYEPVAISEVFPEVDLARLAHYALKSDQHTALLAFRQELRRDSLPV